MATAYYDEYVTLGGLMMGSRAINCFDWGDLLGTADKRGTDFTATGVAGVTARDRVEDAMRVLLRVRIDARWDQDNVRQAQSTWRANLYTLLDAVRTVAETDGVQTLQLTRPGGGPHSADAMVVDGFRPQFVHDAQVELTLDVLLPDGGFL